MTKATKNKGSAAPSLKKVEYLSLVSNVCTEIESHLGFTDKTLAEFITAVGRKSKTVDEFDKKLKKQSTILPNYFVRTVFNVIHGILPPKVRKSKPEVGERSALWVGDSWERVMGLEKEIEMEGLEKARLRAANRENLENVENWEDGWAFDMYKSPVKFVKNTEGLFSRAAALQSALIKERREVRDQWQRAMLDSIPKDLNRPWEDPMPENGERRLAQELTFGERSELSLQEQRQSLPIIN